ncbi:c-type cytochrome, partial [candidate division KSB1 bacterium]|nr:c-type cytochrome [candidate division KSB1 bacterium]
MKRITLLLACAVIMTGCGRNEQPVPPDQRARLENLRQELRKTLGEKYDAPVAAATLPQLKRGSDLFAELCAGCHGARGDGKTEHPGVLLHQPS